MTRKSKVARQPTRREQVRATMPYGKWTTEDGREVLFNRDYMPIWQRLPDGTVSVADKDEWVPWVRQDQFYHDGNGPWHYITTRRNCQSILDMWHGTGPVVEVPSITGLVRDHVDARPPANVLLRA